MFSIHRRHLMTVVATAVLAPAIATQAWAQTPVKLEFLYSPYADYAPFFVAKEFGFFEEFGVDVTLSPKGDSADTIQMLASGNIEATAGSWASSLFNLLDRGATIAIIATMARMPPTTPSPAPFMISQTAWDAGIRSVADLKGKRVGIPGPSGFGIFSVAKALQTAGLTLEDVEPVFLPPTATAPAFANGALEAGWTMDPFAGKIEEMGLARRVVEDHTLNVELGMILFNQDFVAKNEDAVVRFMAAYLKAARLLDHGGWEDDKVLAAVAKYTGTEPDALRGIPHTVRSEDGAIDMASVREQEAFFRQRGVLEYEKPVDIESVYRIDLLNRANDLLARTS